MEYLINEIPKDAPEAICPIYNELDKVKDSITLAKPFLNSREQTQWQNFFKDKEEEGNFLVIYHIFDTKTMQFQ